MRLERLFLIGVFSLAACNSGQNKQGFILNEQVFNEFSGTEVLSGKIERLKSAHLNTLDSLTRVIQETGDADLKILYVQKAEQFEQEETQITTQYTQEIWSRINQYIQAYGKEEGYHLIYGANGDGSLMYADSSINITEDVLQYINQRYEGGK